MNEISKNILTKNLVRMIPKTVKWMDDILKHEPQGIEQRITDHGEICLKKDRTWIADHNEPRLDAIKFIDNSGIDDAQYWIILGIGNGYLVEAVLKANTFSRVLLVEPDDDILVGTLSSRMLDIPLHRCKLVRSLPEIREHWFCGYKMSRPISILCEKYYQETYPDMLVDISKEVSMLINFARIGDSTSNHRLKTWTKNLIQNLQHLGKSPYLGALSGMLQGIPAVIVASGPSLEKNIHLLRGLEDKVLIIAMNSSYSACVKAGVKPHICISIESYNTNAFFEGLPVDDCCFVTMHTSNPAVFDLKFKTIMTMSDALPFFRDFSSEMGDTFYVPNGGSVATAGWQLAWQLGCSDVIVIGQDLGYTDGKVYSSMTNNADGTIVIDPVTNLITKTISTTTKKIYEDSGKSEADFQKVIQYKMEPGWVDGTEVATTDDFIMFRDWYAFTSLDHPEHCYNCTEGGLHINNMTHKPLSDVLASLPLDVPNRFLEIIKANPHMNEWGETYQKVMLDYVKKLKSLRKRVAFYSQVLNIWSLPDLEEIELQIYKKMKHLTLLHTFIKAEVSHVHFCSFDDLGKVTKERLHENHRLRCKALADILDSNILELIGCCEAVIK